MATDLKILSTGTYTPDWCPGCGNFIILNALKRALVKLNLDPKDVVVISGIGCSSKLPQWINTFGFHGVHGRGLPVGQGIKMANKALHVIVVGGDGDVYGEGMHHFMQALRKNINITLLVHDNQIYGLTKGQASPTTMYGEKTSSTPNGYDEQPINPMTIAVSQNAPFVARGYAGNLPHLTDLMAEAINFKGFSFVDILQPCVTFNKHNTFDWFKERVYDLSKTPYKPNDQAKAFKKSLESEDKIPLGVILKTEGRKLFEEVHSTLNQPAPLVKHKMQKVDIRDLMEKLCV